MRILYIGTPYSVHDSKWAAFFSARKEYEVFFVCERRDIPEGKTGADVKEYYKGMNITYLGSLSSFSITHPVATIQSIFALKKLVRENNIELVHILFAAPFALWGLFVPCRYIITTRGSDILLVIPQLNEHKCLKGLYFKWLFRFFKKAFAEAQKITGTSLAQKQKTGELMFAGNAGAPEFVLIRTGVDVDAINSINSDKLLDAKVRKQKFIFSPRYMKPVYNIQLQVEAIGLLDKSIIDQYWFVLIRGESYDKKYFEIILGKLEELKNSKGLKYLVVNNMTQQEIGQYYKHASLTIMTPLSDGTPNTALEAMAAKCPLIVPNLPYDEALFNGTCIKLSSYDAAELAAKITDALSGYPVQMIDKAFEAVNKYGNRKTEMMKLNDIYMQVGKN